MRRCSNCQREMPNNARFCASCGQVLIEEEKTMLIRAIRAKSLRSGAKPRPASLAGPIDGEDGQKRREQSRPTAPVIESASGGSRPGHMPAIQNTPRLDQVPTLAHTPRAVPMPAVPETPGVSSPAAPPLAGAPPATPPPQSFRPVQQPKPAHHATPYGPGARQSGPVHAYSPRQEVGARPPLGQRAGQTGSPSPTSQASHAGASPAAGTGAGATVKILLSLLVGLVIIAGGLGAFVLIRHINNNQPASVATPLTDGGATATPGTSPTPSSTPVSANIFIVSGALTGSMTVVSFRACGTLGAGYAIFAIVSLNGQQYNLNILFPTYHGAGTYTNTAVSDQVNIGLNNGTGGQGTRAWNTPQAHNNGSGIINSDVNSGSLIGIILYSTFDKGKVQLAGNWRCG